MSHPHYNCTLIECWRLCFRFTNGNIQPKWKQQRAFCFRMWIPQFPFTWKCVEFGCYLSDRLPSDIPVLVHTSKWVNNVDLLLIPKFSLFLIDFSVVLMEVGAKTPSTSLLRHTISADLCMSWRYVVYQSCIVVKRLHTCAVNPLYLADRSSEIGKFFFIMVRLGLRFLLFGRTVAQKAKGRALLKESREAPHKGLYHGETYVFGYRTTWSGKK